MIDALLTRLQSCGPRALRRAAQAHGLTPSLRDLRQLAGTPAEGPSVSGLARAARALGFNAIAARADFGGALGAGAPVLAHKNDKHFVLVDHCTPSRVRIAGTWSRSFSREAFQKQWSGVLLTLRPAATTGGRHG